MSKTYDPPLTADPHGPLYRVDKAIKSAQERLDAAIDAKRYHTNHNLAQEVVKEAREALRKSEKARVLKCMELGAFTNAAVEGETRPRSSSGPGTKVR